MKICDLNNKQIQILSIFCRFLSLFLDILEEKIQNFQQNISSLHIFKIIFSDIFF